MLTNNTNHPFKLIAKALKPDNKKRVAIGKASSAQEDVLYDVYINDLGQVMLDPVKTIPAYETWLFENKKALKSVKKGLSDSKKGNTKHLGSFSKYAKD